jgi:hypothetical protein
VKNITKYDRDLFSYLNEKSYPAFNNPLELSVPSNSSPYICRLIDLEEIFKGYEFKLELISNLHSVLEILKHTVGTPVLALVGGSFLQREVRKPNDLDVLLYYKQSNITHDMKSGAIEDLIELAKSKNIDLVLCPYDFNPVHTIKTSVFYTHLYMSSKNGFDKKGCLLIELEDKS